MYLGGVFGGSQVAQVTSGVTPQAADEYEAAVKYSAGFSSTQGKNNWSYQYRTSSEEAESASTGYSNMTYDAAANRWKGNETWLLLMKGLFHPGTKGEAVLKWTAPKAGEIKITGNAADGNPNGGDGVKARIAKGGANLWNSGSIENGDVTGKSHSVVTSVTAGEAIYFIVDNNSTTGNNSFDSTKWDPSIAYKKSTSPGVVKGSIVSLGTDSAGTFVAGWTCQENVNQPIGFDIYVRGVKGKGTLMVSGPATDITSATAVYTACNTPNTVTHNFKYYFPAATLAAEAGQLIYIYGKSTSSPNPDGLLTRSGQVRLPGVPTNELTLRLSPESDELVWDGVNDCIITDGPFQMWKNNIGETFGIISVPFNYALKSDVKGGEFTIPSNKKATLIYKSPQQKLQSYYDSKMWMFGFWTADGKKVYSIAHHEWYPAAAYRTFTGNPAEGCGVGGKGPSISTNSWTNSVHHLTSTNGGLSFTPTVPVDPKKPSNSGRMVLVPEPYGADKPVSPDGVTRFGYFHPSNIVKEGNYYYFTVGVQEIIQNATGENLVPMRQGLMLVRTDDISKPKQDSMYQFWDGDKWTDINTFLPVGRPFIFTHQSGVAHSEKIEGAVASLHPLSFSLKWNPVHKQWILLGYSRSREVSYMLTSSLANPKMSALKVVEGSLQTGPNSGGWFASYPTIIDPDSPGYVFQEVEGEAYMYFAKGEGGTRDIRRMKIEIE